MTLDRPHTLVFAIGPVQGFIAQARRTRDLWAGSFLLSWLAGKAMRAVVDELKGEIVVPAVDTDPLFCALGGDCPDGTPFIGSLPNQFTARVPAGTPQTACRDVVAAAVTGAWTGLGEAVWDAFVKPEGAEQAKGGARGVARPVGRSDDPFLGCDVGAGSRGGKSPAAITAP